MILKNWNASGGDAAALLRHSPAVCFLSFVTLIWFFFFLFFFFFASRVTQRRFSSSQAFVFTFLKFFFFSPLLNGALAPHACRYRRKQKRYQLGARSQIWHTHEPRRSRDSVNKRRPAVFRRPLTKNDRSPWNLLCPHISARPGSYRGVRLNIVRCQAAFNIPPELAFVSLETSLWGAAAV